MYANTTNKFLNPLKKSQNSLMRILQFKHRKTHVNDLYTAFGVLKLKDMHTFNLMILAHKYIHCRNKIPEALTEIFTQHSQVHSYNTRNKYDLHATHYNTKTYGCRKISYITRQNWNSLPNQLKIETSTSKFKVSLKKDFLTIYS